MKYNKSVINIISSDSCTGCLACIDVCPEEALTKDIDKDGFITPKIDKNSCINCGLCLKSCPANNIPVLKNNPILVQASHAKDSIRLNSASGGVFQIIAKQFIKDGGVVVGAAFDNNIKLKHVVARSKSELKPIYRSKYLQSDTLGIYKKVKCELENNVAVLFSGTPCQCAGLKNFLNKEYSKLFIIDIICHGVPSQSLFDKYIDWEEKKKKCEILSYDFRYKNNKTIDAHNWRLIYNKNGKIKEKVGFHFESPFYFGFQKYITLRKSCYSCPYAQEHRVGDITLGDCWGISQVKNIPEHKGVSSILINTSKGHKLFNNINSMLEYNELYSFDDLKKSNGCLHAPTKENSERNEFFTSLKENDFNFVLKKYLRPKNYWIFKAYYSMPLTFRGLIKKIVKPTKYE